MDDLFSNGKYKWATTRLKFSGDLIFALLAWALGGTLLLWVVDIHLRHNNPDAGTPDILRMLAFMFGGVGGGVIFLHLFGKMEALEIPVLHKQNLLIGSLYLPVLFTLGCIVLPHMFMAHCIQILSVPTAVWIWWYLGDRPPLYGDVINEESDCHWIIRACQRRIAECQAWKKADEEKTEAEFDALVAEEAAREAAEAKEGGMS